MHYYIGEEPFAFKILHNFLIANTIAFQDRLLLLNCICETNTTHEGGRENIQIILYFTKASARVGANMLVSWHQNSLNRLIKNKTLYRIYCSKNSKETIVSPDLFLQIYSKEMS